MFVAMSEEENGHRHLLFDLCRAKFGDHIPLIRRRDVKGFLMRPSFWLLSPLGPEKIRAQAELMEAESKRFYLFGGWLMSQMDLAAGVVAARACPSAPEPGPADASCAAPG